MIVLWGPPGDGPLAAVHRELLRRGADILFVDQRRVLDMDLELRVDDGVRARLRIEGRWVALDEVRSVYLRPHDTRRIPAVRRAGEGSPAWDRALQFDEALTAWCELSPALVLNRPAAMASNSSKPYQIEQIRRFGLEVPLTLVTTEPEAVLDFEARHGPLIYKSTSGVRSIVAKLGPEQHKRLDRLRWCPTQFQVQVPGVDWRVHVVGSRVFATRIETTGDDYRYASRQGGQTTLHAGQLPAGVEAACVRAAHGLGLPLAGVDLRQTPDGRWVCFEINPSPGFTWYEEGAGQAITRAVADLLIGERPPHPQTRPRG